MQCNSAFAAASGCECKMHAARTSSARLVPVINLISSRDAQWTFVHVSTFFNISPEHASWAHAECPLVGGAHNLEWCARVATYLWAHLAVACLFLCSISSAPLRRWSRRVNLQQRSAIVASGKVNLAGLIEWRTRVDINMRTSIMLCARIHFVTGPSWRVLAARGPLQVSTNSIGCDSRAPQWLVSVDGRSNC